MALRSAPLVRESARRTSLVAGRQRRGLPNRVSSCSFEPIPTVLPSVFRLEQWRRTTLPVRRSRLPMAQVALMAVPSTPPVPTMVNQLAPRSLHAGVRYPVLLRGWGPCPLRGLRTGRRRRVAGFQSATVRQDLFQARTPIVAMLPRLVSGEARLPPLTGVSLLASATVPTRAVASDGGGGSLSGSTPVICESEGSAWTVRRWTEAGVDSAFEAVAASDDLPVSPAAGA